MPVCILGAMAAHALRRADESELLGFRTEPLLKDADPKVIVTLPEFYPRSSRVAAAMGIPHVLLPARVEHDHVWIAPGSEGLPQPLPQADDYAMMFFTGGTTGFPRAPNIGIATSWRSAESRRRFFPRWNTTRRCRFLSRRCFISSATITASSIRCTSARRMCSCASTNPISFWLNFRSTRSRCLPAGRRRYMWGFLRRKA